MAENEKWILLHAFMYPHDAQFAKGYLESCNIETIILDENLTQITNIYSNAIGGVKLFARESDYKAGIELLSEGGYIFEIPKHIDNKQIYEVVSIPAQISCPSCGSQNVALMKSSDIIISLWHILSRIMRQSKEKDYKCNACSYEWTYKIKKETV